MGFLSRLTHHEAAEEPCPRCATPAPAGAAECQACGWDMHESFHGTYVGSHLTERDSNDADDPGRGT
jgi:hypothetical protein